MNKNSYQNGEAMNAALKATLAVELFLNENYYFRRNVLNGKVEFAIKYDADAPEKEADAEKPDQQRIQR